MKTRDEINSKNETFEYLLDDFNDHHSQRNYSTSVKGIDGLKKVWNSSLPAKRKRSHHAWSKEVRNLDRLKLNRSLYWNPSLGFRHEYVVPWLSQSFSIISLSFRSFTETGDLPEVPVAANVADPEDESPWKRMDLVEKRFGMNDSIIAANNFATLAIAGPRTLLQLFQLFYPETLLRDIWNSHDKSNWVYGNGFKQSTVSGGVFNPKTIYLYLALYIQITGEQQALVGYLIPKLFTFIWLYIYR
jgi:hypothetical protein